MGGDAPVELNDKNLRIESNLELSVTDTFAEHPFPLPNHIDDNTLGAHAATRPKQKLTFWVCWACLLALWSGLFPYGFCLGSINAASSPIQSAFKEYYLERYNETISQETLNLIWAITAASFPVGGIFGCFLVHPITKKFGKLRSMIYLHVLVVISSIFLGMSSLMRSFEIVIIARIIIGLVTSCGGTGIAPMYVVEIAPTRWRGVFGSLLSFFITSSVFLSNLLGLHQILGNDTLWPLLLALTGFPSLVFIIFSFKMPESPRHLYISKRCRESAKKVLMSLRASDDVDGELADMEREITSQASSKQISILEIFRIPSLRLPLITGITLGAVQQLTGLNGVLVYMNQLFIQAGIPEDIAPYCGIAIPGLMSFASICATYVIKRKGRRPLLIIGYVIEGISLMFLVVTVNISHVTTWIPYLSVALSAAFLIGFAVGPGPMTILVVAEFFVQTARSAAVTISCAALWSGFSLVVISWPYLSSWLGGYAYIPFAVIAFGSAVYVYLIVPETKDRSFMDIQASFQLPRLNCLSREEE